MNTGSGCLGKLYPLCLLSPKSWLYNIQFPSDLNQIYCEFWKVYTNSFLSVGVNYRDDVFSPCYY